MEKLTARQEKFCQSIADGKNQTDAYKSAYQNSKRTEKQIWEDASKLADKPKVIQRITELKAQIAKKQLWTREQSVAVLKTIAESKKPQTRDADKVSAIKELNAMHGFNSGNEFDEYVQPVAVTIHVASARISG